MSDSTIITVRITRRLAEQLVGPWYLIKKPDSDAIRLTMRQALAEAEEQRIATLSSAELYEHLVNPE